jgi:PAS domain S-box-containing protein
MRRLLPLTGAISIGLLISLILFFTFRDLEKRSTQAAFERFAQERFDGLEASIALNLNDIVSLGAFFDISQSVTRRDFARFTAPLLEENKAIQALEWAPKVAKNLRQSYEDAARRGGLASFQFTERLSDGQMARAEERQEYYPVFFVEPLKSNESALGFDLLSSAARRKAIERITNTGKLGATSRIVLVQETGDQYGVLVFRPVYRSGAHPSSEKERSETLIGFVLGVIRVGDIVERTGQAGSTARSLGLVVIDLDAPPAERLLYPKNTSFDPFGKLPGAFRATRTISVAGRSWQVAAYPLPGAFPVTHWSSWSALVAGLLLTGFWTAYLKLSQNRHSAIEQVVTERTRALHAALEKLASMNSALEESEARYRKLVDLSPDAIIVGRSQAIVLANKAAVELFGVTAASDLIGRRLADLVKPEARTEIDELVQQMYAGEMQHPMQEGQVLRSDGSLLDVEMAASSFQESGGGVVQAVFRNIVQRKQAEAEHARLIRSIEQVGESIVITDLEASILYVNPAFEKITGYARAEAIGLNPRVLKSDRHPASFYQEMWATLLRGDTWAGKLINRRKDGTLYQEEATISPVRNKDGRVINYVAVKRDVTQETLLRNQLNQAQKMEAVGRLAGGVAHDFNNLLTVIKCYVEMLQDSLSTDDPLRRNTQEIMKAANRAASLTRQMLAFSRKQILSPVVLDLNAVINETAKMLKRVIGEDIRFQVRTAKSLWAIQADSDQIVQILMNLCVNARDAMPQGGTLTVATGNVTVKEGGFGGQPYVSPGDYVWLSVTDTGTGISKDIQEHIFEPFFTTKDVGKGTGLGLSTVYGIVKQSGGYVWVDSELGQGACFTIHLPRVRGAIAPDISEKSEARTLGTGTLLVVEDEEALREAICEFFRSLEYMVLEASSGQEALSVANQHEGQIDLLITDLVMPGMSGRELSQMLGSQRPYLKTIYMSGHTDDAVVRHGIHERGATFIQKPFGLSTLASKVRDTLGRTETVQ